MCSTILQWRTSLLHKYALYSLCHWRRDCYRSWGPSIGDQVVCTTYNPTLAYNPTRTCNYNGPSNIDDDYDDRDTERYCCCNNNTARISSLSILLLDLDLVCSPSKTRELFMLTEIGATIPITLRTTSLSLQQLSHPPTSPQLPSTRHTQRMLRRRPRLFRP
jgi:hypothetical protein